MQLRPQFRRFSQGWTASLLVTGVLWISSGCAGKLQDRQRFARFFAADGGGAPAAPPTCVTALFEERCGSALCHGAGATQVDLVSAGVATRLVNRSSAPSLLCKGRYYLTTDGSPSLLLEKLQSPPPCGAQMPLSGSITSAERSCLESWAASLRPGAASETDGGS